MLLYPLGQLAAARDLLDALGFQRQTGRQPFPEERPMRVGSLVQDGRAFNLHVHVLAASSPEVGEVRSFRERLRGDSGLVAAYVAAKRAILADGVTDPVDYALRKGAFVQEVLWAPRPGAAGGPAVAFPARVETARLVLSRPTDADLTELTVMHSDPRVMATLGGLPTPEQREAMHRRLFGFWQRDGFGWWVARTTDGRFVGRGGVRRAPVGGSEEFEVGYGLVPTFWGQGLATELARESVQVAFEVMRVPDLVCFTLPTNLGSRRVMEKAGFRFAGEVEHAGLLHVLYRLRRADWVGEHDR
jgi:RimJ/RimL family protein N-acetyltransferase